MKKAKRFQPEYQHQEEQQKQLQQEEQPQYGELQGEVIKLGGLDYGLLKQQKDKEEKEKKNFMASLKQKIQVISHDVLTRSNGQTEQEQTTHKKQQSVVANHNEQYQGLIKAIAIAKETSPIMQTAHSNNNKKSQVYLIFELDDFGRRVPMRIEKRIGKMSNKPIFVHFDEKFCDQFGKIMRASQQRSKSFGKGNTSMAMDIEPQNGEQDDDDIFGNDDSETEKKVQPPTKSAMNIQIGKPLNFGLQDDIFASSKKRPTPTGPPLLSTAPTPSDKYSFLHKKIKPSLENPNFDDGYDQCYHQSGPSLGELVDMKKQGIEYYGDLKEWKGKEKKGPNIHREYDMIQKIIEKNSKK